MTLFITKANMSNYCVDIFGVNPKQFRMYTPSPPYELTPGVSTNEDVPIQKIYFVVPDGSDMTATIGNPIIPYHISRDGNLYSDFMNVVLVTAPENYTANDFKSVGDITDSGAAMVETDIVLVRMPDYDKFDFLSPQP